MKLIIAIAIGHIVVKSNNFISIFFNITFKHGVHIYIVPH